MKRLQVMPGLRPDQVHRVRLAEDGSVVRIETTHNASYSLEQNSYKTAVNFLIKLQKEMNDNRYSFVVRGLKDLEYGEDIPEYLVKANELVTEGVRNYGKE